MTAAGPGPGTPGLLGDLLRDTQDPAYAEVAARRDPTAAPARPGVSAALLVALLVLGLLLATAYTQARAAAPDGEALRRSLLSDVRRDAATSDALQTRLEQARQDVSDVVGDQLRQTRVGRDRAAAVAELEAGSGLVAVSGPGVTVTLADAPAQDGVDPVTGATVATVPESGRVLDLDLQAVVNALWAAGAEAVAVDGQRLSATTSIRTAGEAVLVDFQPVLNPYVVRAIGDPGTLLPRFAGSQVAARYAAYSQLYAIGFTVAGTAALELPAAADTDLRYAAPVEQPPPPGTTK